ncbi:MAG TPA: serine/threonine-protein kinase [Gemmatimonadaceae bacterium]|nr:serine/threonine-protein kinase [Gemmatimonadaceae bacterium]
MTFDRALWEQARPLFDELVELDDDARASRLEQIGAEDPNLRKALERLLLADLGEEIDSAFDANPDARATSANPRDPLGIIGRNVSHFSVKDYLAAGGMGVVYTAEDLQLGRTVALKFPLPHQQMDKLVKERFVNEARSAAALDHTNLCTVHEIGESEHGVFLAMPLYPGETLKDRLSREGALPPDEALAIAQQITTGLVSAHAAGIVHRDLKPGNVMLLPDGTVKVLDFGLAKIRDISLTMSHTTIGTIGYVAPEQIRGGRADARADLWSIGVMLYEMLTGHLPFRGEHELSILHNILHTDPALPSQSNKDLSLRFDELIGALLQKDPDARYPTAEALLADITALRSGAPLSHRSPFWARTPGRRRVRTSLRGIVAVGALLLAVGALTWIMYRQRPVASNAAATGPIVKFVNNSTTISTSAELMAVLTPANAGRRVHLRAGTYDIGRPLVVPDGMTLEGEGAMNFAREGYATGFSNSAHTTLRMAVNVAGDLLTLGNNVTVRNLEIVDLEGRSGNVIAVHSRRVADSVSAIISDIVVVNPNQFVILPGGTVGRGLLVITRNANGKAAPPPDDGSVLAVKMLRSVIKSPGNGGGFFAFNFAANSRISLDISHSSIGGSSEANGGVSRPDPVHDSEVRINSEKNIYVNEQADLCVLNSLGLNLTGGSGAPIAMKLPQTLRNRLVVRSVDDRIEGFKTAVLATGSRSFYAGSLNPAPKYNHIELQLIGTRISTPSCAPVRRMVGSPGTRAGADERFEKVRDLRLVGAEIVNEGADAGEGNSVRVELSGVTGSGARANRYANADGGYAPLPPEHQGKGNRLEIVGDPETFKRTNRGIDPIPPVEFFTNRR